jgi:hypothetical protein
MVHNEIEQNETYVLFGLMVQSKMKHNEMEWDKMEHKFHSIV